MPPIISNGLIEGTADDDHLIGGATDDTLIGGAGDDRLEAGNGDNLLIGDISDDDYAALPEGTWPLPGGDDTLVGGSGNDTMYGGRGDDTFVIADGFGRDDIFGGSEGETTGDIIDATSMTESVTLLLQGDEAGQINTEFSNLAFEEIERVNLGAGDDRIILEVPANGVIDAGDGIDVLVLPELEEGEEPPVITITNEVQNPDGSTTRSGFVDFPGGQRVVFKNVEQIKVPCFVAGTLIDTDKGPKAVESLVAGDRVLTRDHGFVSLVWTGQRDLSREASLAWPEIAPIAIAAGALGAGLPARDLVVSPGHRVLVSGAKAELLFGEREVLIAAKDLLGLQGVRQLFGRAVSYVHVMCEGHEILRSEGAWTESFQPSAWSLGDLGEESRAEILRLFPELAATGAHPRFAAARAVLSAQEAQILFAA